MQGAPLIAIFLKALTSRYTGPLASLLVIVLGLALMATSISAGRTEAGLRARIANLTEVNTRLGTYWQARLRSCESAAAGGTSEALSKGSPEDRARRLAARAPAGFDVCARMESADQAVLRTLK
jgi:hypothetical protein